MINFSETIQVFRDTKSGRYVRGKYLEGKLKRFDIEASVQPMGAEMLMLMPEGEREKEMIRIYSEEELFVGNEQEQRKPDVVSYKGKLFEVQKVETWTQVIPHFKSIAALKPNKRTLG